MNKIINQYQSTDIEDVTPTDIPKKVNSNAIHLFLKQMYQQGKLKVLGTPADYMLQLPPKGGNITPSPEPTRAPSHPLLLTNSPHDFSPAPTKPTTIIQEYDIHSYLDIDEDISISQIDSTDPVNKLILDLDVPDSTIVNSVLQDPTHTQIPPQDRVSSTEPKTKVITTEYLQKCLGFRNITTVINNIDTLAQDTIKVRDTGHHLIRSRGETATLPKNNSNKLAIPKPPEFDHV